MRIARVCMLAVLCAALTVAVSAEQADAQSTATATAAHRCSVINAAISHRSQDIRVLSSADVSKAQRMCREARRHISVIRFWHNPKRRWTLYLNQHDKNCWQVKLKGPLGLCLLAREAVRVHVQKLARIDAKLKPLVSQPWQHDLILSATRRSCIAGRETYGSSHPYTQQQLGGGDYWGKYQYDPDSWQKALVRAEVYYHVRISSANRADRASPEAQDAVTAFAVMHPKELGWDPWQECR